MDSCASRKGRTAALVVLGVLLGACGDEPSLTEPDFRDDMPTRQPERVSASLLPATGGTFTVTNTGDSGAGSLRQAINDANATANVDASTPDLIDFDIDAATDAGCDPGSGVCTIQPLSALPQITEAVVLDGYSQSGASPNTNGWGLGLNTALKIELDGSNAGAGADGLKVSADGTLICGLVINRFDDNGIEVVSNGVRVEGNFIGTDVSGGALAGNLNNGVAGDPQVVGGSNPYQRNLISGNGGSGVNTQGTTVKGNLIGTDRSGTIALPNGGGVTMFGGVAGALGGPEPGAGNVISGHSGGGVQMDCPAAGPPCPVQGNYIGVTANGQQPLGNMDGLFVVDNILIGGTDPGAGNVISSNTRWGIFIHGEDVVVQGNLIGTDHTGNVAMGNGTGIAQSHTTLRTRIGGTSIAARNVVAGSPHVGIALGGDLSTVEGNYIGTNSTGTVPLPNRYGLEIPGDDNTVGGTTSAARNVISGNLQEGIRIQGTGHGPALRNVIQGNYIGLAADGSSMGNGGRGVVFVNAGTQSNNLIGGTAPGAGNVIAFNEAGIFVHSGTTGHSFLGNTIHSNDGPVSGLGIDLYPVGVSPNDPGDGDSGPNDLQNFPVITSASSNGSSVTVSATLNSTPSELFTIEFYANPSEGEGHTFVGRLIGEGTDASGHASFGGTFSAPVPAGWVITATATNSTGSTSEFSFGEPIVADGEGPVVTNALASPNPIAVGDAVTLTADADDSTTGGSDIASAEYSLDGGSTWAPMSASDGTFDSVTEGLTAGFSAPATPDVYDVCVRATDTAGNTGAEECIMHVVYDPNGGFVTGGGWIDSPPGAHPADPMAAGHATFGFVSRYKKGASTPTGNSVFRFQTADLRFSSTSYEWLVVNQGGTNAQFKGSGEINGAVAPNGSEYRFMIWAKDGDPDTFRIKIWWENLGVETVVYDNGAQQAIAGGQIKVHQP